MINAFEFMANAQLHSLRLLLFIAYKVGSGKRDAATLAHERRAYEALLNSYLKAVNDEGSNGDIPA